jgi:hypothetical protein
MPDTWIGAERAQREQIRRWLPLLAGQRTGSLRKRFGI